MSAKHRTACIGTTRRPVNVCVVYTCSLLLLAAQGIVGCGQTSGNEGVTDSGSVSASSGSIRRPPVTADELVRQGCESIGRFEVASVRVVDENGPMTYYVFELVDEWLDGSVDRIEWRQECGLIQRDADNVSATSCSREIEVGEVLAVFWFDLESGVAPPRANVVGVFEETTTNVREVVGRDTEYASMVEFRESVESVLEGLGVDSVDDCPRVQERPLTVPRSNDE